MGSDQGEVTLYHHTTSEAATRIMAERRMVSFSPVDRPYAYFSTWIDGNAAGLVGYGEASVEVRVPMAITEVDDGFHSGEQYLRVHLDALRPQHFVTARLPEDDPPERGDHLTWLADQIEASNRELGPSLESYHWHSVVARRGFEQPRLDGGHGAHPDGFCR